MITDQAQGAKYNLAVAAGAAAGVSSSSSSSIAATATTKMGGGGIRIVKSSWLLATLQREDGRRVPEEEHELIRSTMKRNRQDPDPDQDDDHDNNDHDDDGHAETLPSSSSRLLLLINNTLENPQYRKIQGRQQQQQIDHNDTKNDSNNSAYDDVGTATRNEETDNAIRYFPSSHTSIFEHYQFYLIGFDNHKDNSNTNDDDHEDDNSTTIFQQQQVKNKLCTLIRRGKGTIYWELNEDITMLVVSEMCPANLYEAAQIVARHHCNVPSIVFPRWIIAAYQQNTARVSRTAYIPAMVPVSSLLLSQQQRQNKKKRQKNKFSTTSTNKTITLRSKLFRGLLFALVRSPLLEEVVMDPIKTNSSTDDVINDDGDGDGNQKRKGDKRTRRTRSQTNNSTNDNTVVDFDKTEVEAFIVSHGGRILSAPIVDALKQDVNSTRNNNNNKNDKNDSTQKRRKCIVVCWGGDGGGGLPRLETNVLVSQLQRYDICTLTLVTPIWIRTCVALNKCLRPQFLSTVLIPQSWPMRKAFAVRRLHQQQSQQQFRISLTGFHQPEEKIAIVQLIEVLGGVYHSDTSKINTTHLVYKKQQSSSSSSNSNSKKIEKALEWGIHVISVQWLYHILQYGYTGDATTTTTTIPRTGRRIRSSNGDAIGSIIDNNNDGCETRFAFATTSN